MAHSFTFTCNVTLERVQGKFATRDEMAEVITEALLEALENLDVANLGPDGDSEYEVTDTSVDVV